jgi:pimeloyl-ACP methyl ester carboxylesterase
LVLVAPSPPTPEPMQVEERRRLLKSYGNRQAAAQTINNITNVELPTWLREQVIDDNLRSAQGAWRAWLESGSRRDISVLVPHIRTPVLVLAGSKDPVMKIDLLQREVVARLSNVRLTVIPNVGHLIPLEAPHHVATAIDAFVKQLVVSTSRRK